MKKKYILCLLLAVMIGWGFVRFMFRPYSPSVTTAGLERGLGTELPAQVGLDSYVLREPHEILTLLQLGCWELCREAPAGEPVIRFRLAELWILELYADGKAAAYDGYASRKYRSAGFYRIPEECVPDIAAYLKNHGEPQSPAFRDTYFLH